MNIRVENKIIKISLFYIIFLLVYTLNVYLESIVILHGWLKDDSTLRVIIGLLNKLIIWTLPVFLSLNKPLDYLKLKNNVGQGIIAGVGIGLLLCTIRFSALYFFKGAASINFHHNQHLWWEVILLVGLTEEVLFRGFILQKIEEISTFWVANIISTLLFILTHVPHWIILNNYGIIEIVQHGLSLLWFSMFLGWVLRKTQSLWACMIVHSFNNFMSLAIK